MKTKIAILTLAVISAVSVSAQGGYPPPDQYGRPYGPNAPAPYSPPDTRPTLPQCHIEMKQECSTDANGNQHCFDIPVKVCD